MKIKSQTWVLLLVFALLVGTVFYVNNKKKTEAAEATPVASEITFVFTEADGIVNDIEINAATGESVKVARDASNTWVLELPMKAEAAQGSAEAAASQLSSLTVLNPIPADSDPSIFGLDAPAFTIKIVFADGKKHKLEVGDMTPTNSGYYVRLDQTKMMIVDAYGIESLLQLVSMPPYLNTPTPSPLPPTETPVPATETTPTLEPSVTPTP